MVTIMKIIALLLLTVIGASATLIYHPATTNYSTVVLTTTNNLLYVNGLEAVRRLPQGPIVGSPLTVTNSTDTTWGYGAGLFTWDTNHVFVSVGTNLWKRAAISAW